MRLFLYTIILLSINSCGSSTTDVDQQQPISKLSEAWTLFEKKDFATAINHFQSVIDESDDINAYVGIGYSYMFRNDYFNATLRLNQALSTKPINADLLGALVFILNAEGNDINSSNQFADQLLTLDKDWSFGHGLNLTVMDIYLVQAQNYFILADFASSLSRLQLIDSTYSINVDTESGILELGETIELLNPGL